ncbi:MAG: methyltransferase, partial [Candidatus Desulfobacillus denitrificans]
MSFDPARFKREERAGYNLIAARYAESAALRTGLNAALIAAAELKPGQAVLDLASGPGVLARAAARQ